SLEPGATTQQLQKAITSLPELTARKKTIDMHMNIATALLNEIKQRQLDVLFQLEENLSRQAKAKIIEVISDPSKTNCYDKLRLAILYTLAYPDQKGDIQEIEEALKKTEVSTDALAYIKK
ncbi:Vesicle trafficking between the ER and Golgi, partial [Spiromyces aspiralis]